MNVCSGFVSSGFEQSNNFSDQPAPFNPHGTSIRNVGGSDCSGNVNDTSRISLNTYVERNDRAVGDEDGGDSIMTGNE